MLNVSTLKHHLIIKCTLVLQVSFHDLSTSQFHERYCKQFTFAHSLSVTCIVCSAHFQASFMSVPNVFQNQILPKIGISYQMGSCLR